MGLLEVYLVGQSVWIGKDITATITGIWIRGNNHVSYQCSWWDGRTRKEEWFPDFEVQALPDPQRLRVGFREPGRI